MRGKILTIIAALVMTAVLAGCGDLVGSGMATGPSSTFLAWTGSEDDNHSFELVRIDGATGEVTDIGGFNFLPALAYGPDETLYGISTGLYVVDPSNGATYDVGEFNYGSEEAILMCSAAFSPDGTLYVTENSSPHRVFTVDLNDAGLTYVGTPSALVSSIAFSKTGAMYGAFATLYRLDPADVSTLSTVGDIGGGTYITSLTFDSSSDLYGIDIYPSTCLYLIDQLSGRGTPITALGSSGIVAIVKERHSPAQKSALLPHAQNQDPSTLKAVEKQYKERRSLEKSAGK